MIGNINSLPKWAQEQIAQKHQAIERLEGILRRAEARLVKQDDDNQALLDIMQSLSPSLYERWNNGESLVDLAAELKSMTHPNE